MFLYEIFEKAWKKPGGNIYLYSDPHFADPEMVKLRGDKYIVDAEQVARINAKVSKNDTFVCLGDIGNPSFVKYIKAGYKVLIMGNHEKGASNYKRKITEVATFNTMDITDPADLYNLEPAKLEEKLMEVYTKYMKVKKIDNGLFDEVYEGPLMINDRIILSHEPIAVPDYMFNIHGHDHANIETKDTVHHLNVCAEHIDYTPISLINFIKKGGLSKIQNIHRVTVDTATERKQKRQLKNNKQ